MTEKEMIDLADDILQEYTNCYSDEDRDYLVKMLRKKIPECIEIKHGSENMVDLLNQEQAELKTAMIEELGNALYCKQDKFDLSNPFEVAKAVVEEGYRKIHKGAVVLTKEEFDTQITAECMMERTETAREIYIKACDYSSEMGKDRATQFSLFIHWLSKQFCLGVE